MARGSVEFELGIDRHGGYAEQPTAGCGMVAAIARAGKLAFIVSMRGLARVDMLSRRHLQMDVPVGLGLAMSGGRLMNMQAELLVGEAMHRTIGGSQCKGGGRHKDAERVERGNDRRRAPPHGPGQPNKHLTHL